MTSQSNIKGRAFEYACIQALSAKLKEYRKVSVIQNQSFETNKKAWDKMSLQMQNTFVEAATVTLDKLIELEPNLTEVDKQVMTLEFQKDEQGVSGDVRDIVIKRDNIQWEIGISVKHNHEALKHSRIASKLDFGNEWYGMPCSTEYWDAVKPIFDRLTEEKNKSTEWKTISQKNDKVYMPLLKAFVKEIQKSYTKDVGMIKRMMVYLVGKRDYHKVISKDDKKTTLVRTFNIRGELNKASKTITSSITVPRVTLPTELISIRLKPKSNTMVEMYLNNGWQLSFRIHNASLIVQPSLKFDVQYVGLPQTVLCFCCKWK